MKKIFVLSISMFVIFAMSTQAALKSTDEMSKMSLTNLQAYFSSLSTTDVVQAITNCVATNNSRFIRVVLIAAQNTINAKPAAERQALLDAVLAANPGLTGTLGAGDRVILTVATNILKTDKIGSETPTASKVASEQ